MLFYEQQAKGVLGSVQAWGEGEDKRERDTAGASVWGPYHLLWARAPVDASLSPG